MAYIKGSDGRPILPIPYPECPVCKKPIHFYPSQDKSHDVVNGKYRKFCWGCEQWAHTECMMVADGKHYCHACWQSFPNLHYVIELTRELTNPGESGFDALVTLFSMILYFKDDVDKISDFTGFVKDDIQSRIDKLIEQKIWVDGHLLMDKGDEPMEEVVDFLMIALASEGLVKRTYEDEPIEVIQE